MTYAVDFTSVSTVGLESSPVADALAGLRANEARYFKNKYDHVFTVEPASKAEKTIAYVAKVLADERDIVIESPPLEATEFEVAGIRWAYVFYESGLSINVMYTTEDASDAQETIDYVHRILKEERDITIASKPLEATSFQVENIRMAYVFYESGLSINVLYTLDDAGKRAVGFKLSDGMEVPEELASRFKFARQKSKLAGTIRGSFFVLKKEH